MGSRGDHRRKGRKGRPHLRRRTRKRRPCEGTYARGSSTVDIRAGVDDTVQRASEPGEQLLRFQNALCTHFRCQRDRV